MWVMDCIECHTTREERGSLGKRLGKRLGGKGESGEETWRRGGVWGRDLGERGSLGKRLACMGSYVYFLFYQVNMDYQDQLEQQKSDAKNAVEEYVYNMRDKISSSLQEFITEEDRTKFLEQLDATEEWLYDEGEDQPKKVYDNRLKVQQHVPSSWWCTLSHLVHLLLTASLYIFPLSPCLPPSYFLPPSLPLSLPSPLFPSPHCSQDLQKLGDPVELREREKEERPGAFEELGATVVHFEKILGQYAAGVSHTRAQPRAY